MQVVVSTSLQTCSARSTPAPGTGPACPEILTICKVAWLIKVALRFFQLDQKAFEFGGVRVWIDHGRTKTIGEGPRVPTGIFLNSAIALMNGKTDLINLLAINHHWLDALGDESFCHVVTAGAGHLHLVVAFNTQLLRQFDRNLDERLRYELHVHRIVF